MAQHPPDVLKPKNNNDDWMRTFNFILFYLLSVIIGAFQIPWNMRSIKNNGPSFSASLVILFGVIFSSIFDFLLFEGEDRDWKGILGGFLYIIGVYFMGYERHLNELNKKRANQKAIKFTKINHNELMESGRLSAETQIEKEIDDKN